MSETAIPERLVVLSCPWEHRHLWPADVEPYPRECMAMVASLPNGEWPKCGKHLRVSRYVMGEQNGRDANSLRSVETPDENGSDRA